MARNARSMFHLFMVHVPPSAEPDLPSLSLPFPVAEQITKRTHHPLTCTARDVTNVTKCYAAQSAPPSPRRPQPPAPNAFAPRYTPPRRPRSALPPRRLLSAFIRVHLRFHPLLRARRLPSWQRPNEPQSAIRNPQSAITKRTHHGVPFALLPSAHAASSITFAAPSTTPRRNEPTLTTS